jgi:hypothetical protein
VLASPGMVVVVLRLDMVENSTSLCKPISGRFWVMRRSRQAFSSRSQAPSECFCEHLHPSLRDMIQHPIWPVSLSSENRQQWTREHLARRPSPVGSAGCHGWRTRPVALRQTVAPSFARLHERYPQRFVRTHKMIIRSPPLQMGEQVWRLLSCCPGSTSQCGYAVADGQIQPLNKGGVQPSRVASSL